MLVGVIFIVPNCFNKEAQSFTYGKPFTKEVEDLFISYAQDIHVQGVCLLGGEIFHQDLDGILKLVRRIKNEVNKPIYCWTGFLWDDLVKDNRKLEILKYIDVIIDGKFEEDKKDLSLKHKGSWNQREIDVKKSLSKNEIILWEE